jgi:hypothetical protein
MRIAKTFSFTQEDKDILDFIEKQPNMSQYIKELIKTDMKNQGKNLEQLIQEYIEKYMSEHHKRQ